MRAIRDVEPKRPRAKPERGEPDFMTPGELMHRLGCSPSALWKWVEEGRIPPPHARIGRRALWLRKHYKAFVATGEWPKDAFW
jgi:predicted DNA-binding transcriptional regulator AlpA